MGGGKKAQRTKGNAKPSSSGRSANLLSNKGFDTQEFVGFESQKTDFSIVPVTGSGFDDDCTNDASTLDGDVKMVMRKMSKRDVVTKVKAMQEFEALCKEKTVDTLKATLPFWPRLYNRLSCDYDRRVRDATQSAHKALMLKVERHVAPHLKKMMGSWFTSCSDLYAPAASTATSALSSTFAAEKLPDALLFCKTAIMKHIVENLVEQTVNTMSDPKYTTAEDIKTKYVNVVSSCLLSVSRLFEYLPSDKHFELRDDLQTLLSNSKFWKLAKHEDIKIQASFYLLLSSVCRHVKDVAISNANKICPLVFGQISTCDPIVSSSVWECLLLILKNIPDCWDHVNVQKAVIPQLLYFVRVAGKGNATVLFPNLLPLLSRLPVDDELFFSVFLSAMRQGLSLDNFGKKELNAIIKAYVECFSFALNRTLASNSASNIIEMCNSFVDKYLMVVIRSSFVDVNSSLFKSKMYVYVREILLQKSSSQVSISTSCFFSSFWEQFKLMSVDILSNEGVTSYDVTLPRISNFFSSICSNKPEPTTSKDDSKVKFNETSSSAKQKCSEPERMLLSNINPIIVDSMKNVHSTILQTIGFEFKAAYASFISSTAKVFDSDVILSKLIPPESNVEKFVVDVLFEWFRNAVDETLTKNQNISLIVLDVLFIVAETMSKERSINVLQKLVEEYVADCTVLDCILGAAFKSCNEYKTVKLWLHSCDLMVLASSLLDNYIEQMKSNADMNVFDDDHRSCCNILSGFCHLAMKCDDSNPRGLSSVLNFILKLVESLSSLVSDIFFVESPPFYGCTEITARQRQQLYLMCDLYEVYVTNYCRVDGNQDEVVELSVKFCRIVCLFGKSVPGELLAKIESLCGSHLMRIVGDDGSKDVKIDSCIDWMNEVMFVDFQNQPIMAENIVHICENLEMMVDSYVRLITLLIEQYSQKSNRRAHDVVIDLIRKSCDLYFAVSSRNFPSLRDKVGALEFYSLSDQLAVLSDEWYVDNFGTKYVKLPFEDAGNEAPTCVQQAVVLRATYIMMLLSKLLPSTAVNEKIIESVSDDDLHNGLHHIVYNIFFILSVYTDRLSYTKHQDRPNNKVRRMTSAMESRLRNILTDFIGSTSDASFRKSLLGYLVNRSLSEGHISCLILKDYIEVIDDQKEIGEMVLDKLRREVFDKNEWKTNPFDNIAVVQTISVLLSLDALKSDAASDLMAVLDGTIRSIPTLTDCLSTMTEEMSSEKKCSPRWIHSIHLLCQLQKQIESDDQSWDLLVFILDQIIEVDAKKSTILDQLADSRHLLMLTHIATFLQFLVDRLSAKMMSHHWDFLLCRLGDWMQNLTNLDCKRITEDFFVELFVCRICKLFGSLIGCIERARKDLRLSKDNLVSEWDEFFAEALFTPALCLFIKLSEHADDSKGVVSNIVFADLSNLLREYPQDLLLLMDRDKLNIPLNLRADMHDEYPDLPDGLQSMLNHLCPLLSSAVPAVRSGAYGVLEKIVQILPQFIRQHSKNLNEVGSKVDEKQIENERSPPASLMTTVRSACQMVNRLFDMDDENTASTIGDGDRSESIADNVDVVETYLMCWLLILNYFNASTSELRSSCAQYLHESGSIDKLLIHLFNVMPSVDDAIKCDSFDDHRPKFNSEGDYAHSTQIQRTSCQVFFKTLKVMPALVRQWWNKLNKKDSIYVERFTSKHVSHLLTTQEIQDVQRDNDKQFDNMTVKTRPLAREVVATYTVDEISMELIIQLPTNHPLGPVIVECGRRIGVGHGQWRNWMLQLTTFLMHQNGSILEGLNLWKKNVDKRFEGVEECMICFYVLHGTTCQLPKLKCRTCKKKYHSACLYKWFNTSNKSTCPLCRNLF